MTRWQFFQVLLFIAITIVLIDKTENGYQLTGLCATALRYSSSFITIGPFLYSSSLVAAKGKYSL